MVGTCAVCTSRDMGCVAVPPSRIDERQTSINDHGHAHFTRRNRGNDVVRVGLDLGRCNLT